MRYEFFTYLNKLTKHTNLQNPRSDFVNGTKFPDQNTDLLNHTISLKYRDYYNPNFNDIKDAPDTMMKGNDIVYSRPKDDFHSLPDTYGPEDIEEGYYYHEGNFKVIRADATAPYRLIAMSADGQKILLNSSRPYGDGYEFERKISIYPIQRNEYIGLGFYSQYTLDISGLLCCTLRIDAGEPCTAILMELLGSTGQVRFLLGDEALQVLDDYWDPDGTSDYNGRDAIEYANPVDVDGGYPEELEGVVYFDINGGPANYWHELYKKDCIMTDDQIAEFRLKVLEEKTIYGTV